MLPFQNKVLHAMLAQTNLTEQKCNLVHGISKGRTEKSSELTNMEANELINYLRTQPKAVPLHQSENDARADKMRKKIISLAWQMNWVTSTGSVTKCDMKRIDNWCAKYGHPKKEKLNDYIYSELPKLLTQFQNVYNSYLNAVSKPI